MRPTGRPADRAGDLGNRGRNAHGASGNARRFAVGSMEPARRSVSGAERCPGPVAAMSQSGP